MSKIFWLIIDQIIHYIGEEMFLIKNNLKSFLIHIILSIISVFIFISFNSVQAKWVSEEAARNHHNSMMVVAVTLIVISVILYYLLGGRFLINQGSIYKNLFSTSLTAIIGVFLWLIAFNVDLIGQSSSLLNSELWQFYSIYNGYSLFYLNESTNNNPYVFLFSSFIPTIAMCIGVLRKRS